MANRASLSMLLIALALFGCTKRPTADIRISKDAAGQESNVTLVGKNVRDDDLKSLADKSSLRELSLQECSQVTDAGIAGLQSIIGGLTKLSMIRVPVSDDGLKHFSGAKSLADLTLAHTNVTGAGLAHLSNLPIVRMSLQSRVVKGEALAAIANLQELQDLELQCQDLTLASLPALGKLSKLQSLVAFRTPVGPGGIESLRGLAQLRKLVLFSKDIDDASIDALNTLTNLEELEIASASLTDVGLGKLKLPKLKNLSLDSCTGITDAGLANFGGMPELERLMLGGSSVQGKDLTPLANLKKLKNVLIMGNQFKGNSESIGALKKLLPDCEVSIMRG